METREISEQIQELVHEQETEAAANAREREESRRRDEFRQRAALVISVLAVLLAIFKVGAGNATEDIISKNIEVSDTWNFYQAKNIRQTEFRIGAEVLETLVAGGVIGEAARPAAQQRIQDFRATVERYETEPEEGKRDLMAKAQRLEHERDVARLQDSNFDTGEMLLEIAIVLGSVAILAASRPILILAIAFGAVGSLFGTNGFWLFMRLPWQ